MIFRAVFLTVAGLAALAFAAGYLLRPFWCRIWRYWCALKAQDEEQRCERLETEKLRAEALEELEKESLIQPK